MRRLLRAEASALARELAKHQDALKKRLQELDKRLQKDSDTRLLSDLGQVRDDLSSVRRGLARLSIAEQSTRKLKNEWHDWMRHAELSEGVDHALREERLEMLASELRLRGHAPEGAPHEADIRMAVTGGSRPSPEETLESLAERVPSAEEGVHFEESSVEDEAEVDAAVDWASVGEYWDQVIAGCHPRHTDVAQLARLLKAFRVVQGERKRLDRRQGIQRYRLTAFETWT